MFPKPLLPFGVTTDNDRVVVEVDGFASRIALTTCAAVMSPLAVKLTVEFPSGTVMDIECEIGVGVGEGVGWLMGFVDGAGLGVGVGVIAGGFLVKVAVTVAAAFIVAVVEAEFASPKVTDPVGVAVHEENV